MPNTLKNEQNLFKDAPYSLKQQKIYTLFHGTTIIEDYSPDDVLLNLIGMAKEASHRSYSPYSGFKVGAALQTEGGTVQCGTNVETINYQAVCAEASAISNMITNGFIPDTRKIKTIVVYAPGNILISPCGQCRQRILELGSPETKVYMVCDSSDLRETSIQELLPFSFQPDSLKGNF